MVLNLIKLAMQKEGISDTKRKTAPKRFNPFTDRVSRDIRNSLSEAFVKSLKAMDQSDYRKTSHKWLSKNLAPMRRYSHCLTFIANLNVLLEKLNNLDPVPSKLENPAILNS